jgi:RNA polymerase sigma factor (sigma-70 family)
MVTASSELYQSRSATIGVRSNYSPGRETGHAARTSKTAIDERSDHPRFYREELYAEFAPLVKRLLRQYGTDAEIRRDLTGEIYCLFCSFVEAYDPARGVPLRPYLVRQLTASVYTYVRREWTRNGRELSDNWSDGGVRVEQSYDPTASWITELSDQQLLATLPDAIAQLPDRQRKVLLWRYYDDVPFEEIARVLCVEQSTCRSLLRHALSNLRKRLVVKECSESST